jgi:predicted signal transduction protein with EAL and GGDEF domain
MMRAVQEAIGSARSPAGRRAGRHDQGRPIVRTRRRNDAKDAAITANVINLAHALGLRTVAEGIETDGQLSSMRDLGCDLAQGYHFARPMPPHQLSELLPASSAESQDHDARANAA